MNLSYEKATESDIEAIYEFNKYVIDRYENIQNIEYEKVLNWVHRKIETYIDEYQRILFDGELAGYFRFHRRKSSRCSPGGRNGCRWSGGDRTHTTGHRFR